MSFPIPSLNTMGLLFLSYAADKQTDRQTNQQTNGPQHDTHADRHYRRMGSKNVTVRISFYDVAYRQKVGRARLTQHLIACTFVIDPLLHWKGPTTAEAQKFQIKN